MEEPGKVALGHFRDNVKAALFQWWQTDGNQILADAETEFVSWFMRQRPILDGITYTQEWLQSVESEPDLNHMLIEVERQIFEVFANEKDNYAKELDELYTHLKWSFDTVDWAKITNKNYLKIEIAHDFTTYSEVKRTVNEYKNHTSIINNRVADGLDTVFDTQNFEYLIMLYFSDPTIAQAIVWGLLKWDDVKEGALKFGMQMYTSLKSDEEIARLYEVGFKVFQLTKLQFLIDRGYRWSEEHQVWWKSSNAYHKDPDHNNKTDWRHNYEYELPVLTFSPKYNITYHSFMQSTVEVDSSYGYGAYAVIGMGLAGAAYYVAANV